MYNLRLNNEELLTLRHILECIKAGIRTTMWSELEQDLLMKITLCQIDAEEQDEAESQAERYAANLHAMPEGS